MRKGYYYFNKYTEGGKIEWSPQCVCKIQLDRWFVPSFVLGSTNSSRTG